MTTSAQNSTSKGKKGSTASTNKKPKAKASKVKAAPQYAVGLRFGTNPKGITLDAAKVDHAKLADIAEQAAGKQLQGVKAVMQATSMANWPAEAQGIFWGLWRAVKDGRDVSLVLDGKPYARPIDAALGVLISPDIDPEAFSRSLAFVGQTIARCYPPEDSAVYIEAAVRKLQELGVKGKPLEALRSQIRKRLKAAHAASGLVGNGATAPKGEVNPYALAHLFLEREHRLDDDEDEDEDEDDEDDEEQSSGAVNRWRYGLRYYDEQFYRRRTGVWVVMTAEDVRLELTAFLQEQAPAETSSRRIGDVLVNVKSLCRLIIDRTPALPIYLGSDDSQAITKDRKLLALQNGLLDLDAQAKGGKPKLLPHDPHWFSTSVLPYKFDPVAKCPKWVKFVREVFDADAKTGKPAQDGDHRIDVLQEVFGYCLLPDARFQKFFVLTGDGQNGKGVTARLLRAMLGAENVTSVGMEALGERFGLAPLLGKLANVCGDLNEVDNVAEGVLKQLTGEDVLTIDRKHRDAVELVPNVKLVFVCNDLPRLRDKSSGTWRREIAIPYRKQIANGQVDQQLTRKLAKELPGILNWAIAGLRRLLEQQQFTDCAVCQAAVAKHRHYCDPVAQFVEERCVLAVDGLKGKYRVNKDVLYKAYKEWCEESGIRPAWKSTFGGQVSKLPGVFEKRPSAEQKGGKRVEVWEGIALGAPDNVVPPMPKVKHKPGKPTLTHGDGVKLGKSGKPVPANKPAAKGKPAANGKAGKSKAGEAKGVG